MDLFEFIQHVRGGFLNSFSIRLVLLKIYSFCIFGKNDTDTVGVYLMRIS